MNNNIRNFDIRSAHALVREQKSLGNDVEWDGWDIVFYRSAPQAKYSQDGVWRNGEWAFANRVELNSEGIWKVEERNIWRKRPRYLRNRPRRG